MDEADVFTDRLNPEMCVVTAAAEGRRAGCLVGFFSQCSIRPLRFMVWLSTANHTYEVARAADFLAVHLLDREQHDLAELFGGECGARTDKFARVRWRKGPGGTILLEDAAAWFAGTVVRRVEDGDHTGFVLEPVERGGRAEGHPLRLRETTDIAPGHPVD